MSYLLPKISLLSHHPIVNLLRQYQVRFVPPNLPIFLSTPLPVFSHLFLIEILHVDFSETQPNLHLQTPSPKVPTEGPKVILTYHLCNTSNFCNPLLIKTPLFQYLSYIRKKIKLFDHSMFTSRVQRSIYPSPEPRGFFLDHISFLELFPTIHTP